MKNTLKLFIIGLILITGIITYSCTNGEGMGTGGKGNLNILDIPATYNKLYMEVSVEKGSEKLSFNPARVRISKDESPAADGKGKVKAQLFDTAHDAFDGDGDYDVLVTIYKKKDGTDTADAPSGKTWPMNIGKVKFLDGGGVIYWPK